VDAGIEKELVFGDPKAPRFVLWGGRLRPTPSGPDVLTFDLLSLWGKLRAGLGAAGIKAKKPGAPAPCSSLHGCVCSTTDQGVLRVGLPRVRQAPARLGQEGLTTCANYQGCELGCLVAAAGRRLCDAVEAPSPRGYVVCACER